MQPTHSFNFNAHDALIHSAIEKEMRQQKPSQTYAQLERDFKMLLKTFATVETFKEVFIVDIQEIKMMTKIFLEFHKEF